jgi:hypothetical protein
MDLFATNIAVERHYCYGEVVEATVTLPGSDDGEGPRIEYGCSDFRGRGDASGKILVDEETFAGWLTTLEGAGPLPSSQGGFGLDGYTTTVDLARSGSCFSLAWWGSAPESWEPFEEVAEAVLKLVLDDCGLEPAGP